MMEPTAYCMCCGMKCERVRFSVLYLSLLCTFVMDLLYMWKREKRGHVPRYDHEAEEEKAKNVSRQEKLTIGQERKKKNKAHTIKKEILLTSTAQEAS